MREAAVTADGVSFSRFLMRAALLGSVALTTVTGTGPVTVAHAQGTQTLSLNIGAQNLGSALTAFADKAGIRLLFPSQLVAGKTSPALSGTFSREQALSQLLAGSGLVYQFTDAGTVTISDPASASRAPLDASGAVVLGTINVSGLQNASPADAPFSTPAPTAYISGERIERFRGTTPSDMFTGTPGVLSGEARNGSAIDVNIRGMQGMGRVPVSVDGSLSSATVYQGYQGVGNRSYIDPDLIGGISIQKGPGTGAYGGIAGSVSMETLKASDILLDGRNYGIRLKGGFGSNSSGVPARSTVGGMYFSQSKPGTVLGPADMARPALLEPTRGFGSIAGAAQGEGYEFVAAYAGRRNGNYHAGRNGPSAASSEDVGPRSICRDYGSGYVFCTNYPSYYENTGVSLYRGGEKVLNTSSDTDSWLLKAKFDLPQDHSLELSHTGFRSDHGDIRASILSSMTSVQATQRWTSTAAVDRYSARHRWNPDDNDLIDLRSGLWLTSLDIRNPTTAHSLTLAQMGLPDPLRTRVLVGTDTRQWGADVSNTSRFGTALGDISLNYGLSYLHEDTRPTELSRAVEEFLPPNGVRHEWQGFMNANWKPLDWLTIDGSLRYQDFSARDRSTKEDSVANSFAGQQRGRSASGISPTLGVSVEPVEGLQLFARYSEALRMPALAESSALAATFNAPGVRPERAHSWDVGINYQAGAVLFADDDLKLKLGWFHNDVDDYIARRIVNVTTSFGTNYDGPAVGNIARAKFEGIEFSGHYALGGLKLELGASYYTDMAFCPESGVCQRSSLYGDYATNHVPPKYTTSLTASHKFLDDALTLGARATHVGPRTIRADQPTAQGAAPFIVPVDWRPYVLVDVFASYEISESLKADFRIDNVGDVHYVDPLGLANIPGPGRTFWASLSAKF